MDWRRFDKVSAGEGTGAGAPAMPDTAAPQRQPSPEFGGRRVEVQPSKVRPSLPYGYIKALEDQEKISTLLEIDPNAVEYQDKQQNTLLHLACKKGYFDAAKLLIKGKADPSLRNAQCQTPADCAIQAGLQDIAYWLHKQKQPAASTVSTSSTEAVAVTGSGDTPVEPPESAPFPRHIITALKFDMILKRWLRHRPALVSQRDSQANTLLHIACQKGIFSAVKLLVEHNASLAAKNGEGDTPEACARNSGHQEIVQWLQQQHKPAPIPQVSAPSEVIRPVVSQPDTIPEYLASILGSPFAMSKLLTEQPRLFSYKDGNGNSLLHLACHKGYAETVRLLLNRGFDQTLTNHQGKTPMELAEAARQQEVLIILIEYIAQPASAISSAPALPGVRQSVPVSSGHDAIQQAQFRAAFIGAKRGNYQPLLDLIRKGLRVNSPELARTVTLDNGFLCDAVRAGQVEIVRWLTDHNSIRSIAQQPVATGETALSIAITMNAFELVWLLRPFCNLKVLFQEKSRRRSKKCIHQAIHENLELSRYLDAREQGMDHNSAIACTKARPFRPEIINLARDRQTVEAFERRNKWLLPTHPTKKDTGVLAIDQEDMPVLGAVIRTNYWVRDDRDSPMIYDNLIHCAIDADGRSCLWHSFQQLSNKKGGYLVRFQKVNDKNNPFFEEEIAFGNKPITRNSKLVITGHGPKMAGMTGAEFATQVDRWLSRHGCRPCDTPKITLTSCRAGSNYGRLVSPAMTHYEQSKVPWQNFAKNFTERLAEAGRYPEVTSSQGTVIISKEGYELCAYSKTLPTGAIEVSWWQGDAEWLDDEFCRMNSVTGCSYDNYKNDLVQVFKYDFLRGRVESFNKHDEGMVGLHTRMPDSVPVG